LLIDSLLTPIVESTYLNKAQEFHNDLIELSAVGKE